MRLHISKTDACWGPSGGSRGRARKARPPPPRSLFLDQTKARPEGRGAYTDLPKNHALDLALTYMLYFN